MGDDWAESEIVIRAMSTRPVQIHGESHRTAVAREALESMIVQARDGFIPMTREHLDFLPPIGRWHDGRLVEANDGATELELIGRPLRFYVPTCPDPTDPIALVDELAEGPIPAGVDATLTFEGRNFSQDVLERIADEASMPTEAEIRWSVLPPIIWTISVIVTWGGIKFTGAFFEELGKQSAQSFAAWIRRMWNEAEEPDRDRVLAVQFVLADDSFVTAFGMGRHDADDEAVMVQALERLGDVASFVGLQRDRGILGDDMKRAAIVFDAGMWHLAWWTDGDRVFETNWFQANAPDASRFLGHPLA
jgi:hypothetical protein